MCDCCDCHAHPAEPSSRPRRRGGVLGFLAQIVLLYVLLVFGGGTLINTGHPVAAEVGRLLHTVTLVDPGIRWAESEGHDMLAHGLRTLSTGVTIG